MKYAWIKEHRDEYSVVRLCREMQVSKSGFYRWLHSKPSCRSKRTAAIRDSVLVVYQQSNCIYGSYKIAEKLKTDERLESACRNTVAKAMKDLGIKSRVSSKFKLTTTVSDPHKKPAPNILAQDFKADAPNQKWVADITYLPTQAGWVYLAVVIFDRFLNEPLFEQPKYQRIGLNLLVIWMTLRYFGHFPRLGSFGIDFRTIPNYSDR